jgi:hypothetical protein
MDQKAIKRPQAVSPLLAGPIIERDYTQGIESQLESEEPGQSGPSPGAEGAGPGEAEHKEQFTHSDHFEPDETKGFSFEEPVSDDPSDIGGDEPPGFDLSSTTAKAFANTIGDLIKVYVPQITFSYSGVDLSSIKMHVNNGNMQAGMVDAFLEVNKNTFEKLQFEDDEIKMWKKAFKEYLEYKNVKFANPENSFWMATIALFGVQTIKGIQANKQNKQFIHDAIMSYNPEFFESFKAKNAEEPEKEEKSEEGNKSKKSL